MALGVTLRIFLPDGTPEGVRLVSKSNWTGLAVAVSRARYSTARVDREEFRSPGVYVLVGPPESAKYEARIYVGEGEDPRARLDSHHTKKDFWSRLVLFTSSGQQLLNKATIRYLEARLLELAAAAGRAELDNGTGPGLPPLTEAEQQDAESFLSDMLIIYPLLGLNVFEAVEQAPDAERLFLTGPQAAAEGVETEDGFIVFAGAKARSETVESMPPWALGLRQALVDSGALSPVDNASLVLGADHEFKSPSAAAAVLLGRSAAGPLEWKNAAGVPLRQLREEEIADGEAPLDP